MSLPDVDMDALQAEVRRTNAVTATSGVEHRLGALAETIVELEAIIDRLRSRLNVVLLSEPDVDERPGEPTSEMSQLAEILDAHARRLRANAAALARLTDRIDL